jgi:hypothetical protein
MSNKIDHSLMDREELQVDNDAEGQVPHVGEIKLDGGIRNGNGKGKEKEISIEKEVEEPGLSERKFFHEVLQRPPIIAAPLSLNQTPSTPPSLQMDRNISLEEKEKSNPQAIEAAEKLNAESRPPMPESWMTRLQSNISQSLSRDKLAAGQKTHHDVPVIISRSGYSLALIGSTLAIIAAVIAFIDGVRTQGLYLSPSVLSNI